MNKCVATLTIGILAVWTASAQQEGQKAGAYLGYDYNRFYPNNSPSINSAPSFRASGGSGQFVYNFNNWLGAVADVGGVHNGDMAGFHADTTIVNILGGPRVTLLRRSRFKPFFEFLLGTVYGTSSTAIILPPSSSLPTGPIINPTPGQPITTRFGASQWVFGLMAGGGLDIRVTRHLTFRPVEVDYYMTRLQNLPSLGVNNQNNLRYSAGLMYWFGGEKPQASRQITKTCPGGAVVPVDSPCPKQNFSMSLTASSAEVCPGQTVTLTPSFSGVAANQLSFSAWYVNGQQVSQAGSYDFQSDNRSPGTYTVKLTTGSNTLNPGSAETTITVLEYQPPTGTVEANPAEIRAGQTSTLSANFHGQCGGAIQSPTYQASEGTVQGDQFDSSSIQWDTSNGGEQRKTVTITAQAADNQTVGTATTTIEVIRGATAAPVRLPDVLFPDNSSRVNNCGKRILLEQLRAYYERDSSGTVVLVGHSSPDETAANLAQQRVDNAAAIITAGTGTCLSIPQTQVQVSAPGADQNGVSYESGFCRSSVGTFGPESEMRRVEVWFVPPGSQLPPSVTNSQAASTLSLSGLGCPR